MTALVAETRTLMTRSSDARVRRAAVMALALGGAADILDRVSAELDELSAEQREHLAEQLVGAPSTNALALLRRLLRDPSPEVRAGALNKALLSEDDSSYRSAAVAPEILNAAFEALTAPDALLKPTDIQEWFYYGLDRANRERKDALRNWAVRLIAPAQREPLQVLGFVLLAQTGQDEDRKRFEARLKDDSPLIRRAVWRALALAWPEAFQNRVEEAVADASPLVRETVVAAAAPKTYNSQWQIRFSADAVTREQDGYSGWSDTSSARAAVPPAVVRRLWEKESDAAVRVGAGLALLESRRSIDLGQLAAILATLPPGHRSRELTTRFMIENQKTLGPAFRVLLPYMEGDRDSELAKIERALGDNATANTDTNAPLFRARTDVAAVAASPAAAARTAAPSGTRLVFFHQTGCPDCARVARWLTDLRTAMPGLSVEEHDIGLQRAMELNEALCARFEVSARDRLVAPAVFGGGGALVRRAITPAALMRLAEESTGIPPAAWYPSDTEVTEKAAPALRARGRNTGLPLVLVAGLLDGINPCAFATLIFFLSYMQLVRRTPRELLQVGAAFITGVFLTYFAIGLGLREVVGRLESLPLLSLMLKLAIAGLTLVLALLNLRDGVRCRQGRLAEMTLQLPAVLKQGIHATIRGGARLRRYVAAAFVMSVIVSVLELACTGQGYLPTIAYLWQAGYERPAMLGLLAVYNLAFVVPLIVVFFLAYRGLRSEALVQWLQRHAASVKFATAALFLALCALLAWQVWVARGGGR